MRQITQTAEVLYSAVTVKDAVIMAETMNNLQNAIAKNKVAKQYSELPRGERENYNPMYSDTVYIPRDSMEAIYNILKEIGFTATEEPKEYKLTLKEQTDAEQFSIYRTINNVITDSLCCI